MYLLRVQNNDTLTVAEAASAAKATPQTIRNEIKRGNLQGRKLSSHANSPFVIFMTSFRDWMKKRPQPKD